MREQEVRELYEAYLQVHQPQEEVEQLDEALTGERLQRAKEIIERDPKSPKAKAVKRVAGSQEGSDRGDTVPGDLPRDRRNTTLPTGRGGRGSKGRGKTTNRPGGGGGYPLGGRVGQSDQGRGNRATRRSGGDVEDTRYDESFDLFDTILEHLVAEGYADTNEAALVIMANMSEEWRQDIMEKEDSEYEKASDAALDKRYGYGRASGDKRSFGRAANRSSAAAALRALRRGERSGSGTSREAGADAVHQGWATTARTSADQTPEKKAKRAKLADTSYSNLPDDEKEKDRVSFDAVRATYNKNKK